MIVFRTPRAPTGAQWRLVVDTAAASPGDIPEPGTGPLLEGPQIVTVRGHSLMISVAEEDH